MKDFVVHENGRLLMVFPFVWSDPMNLRFFNGRTVPLEVSVRPLDFLLHPPERFDKILVGLFGLNEKHHRRRRHVLEFRTVRQHPDHFLEPTQGKDHSTIERILPILHLVDHFLQSWFLGSKFTFKLFLHPLAHFAPSGTLGKKAKRTIFDFFRKVRPVVQRDHQDRVLRYPVEELCFGNKNVGKADNDKQGED